MAIRCQCNLHCSQNVANEAQNNWTIPGSTTTPFLPHPLRVQKIHTYAEQIQYIYIYIYVYTAFLAEVIFTKHAKGTARTCLAHMDIAS